MADPPSYPDPGDDTGEEPDRRSITGIPRWVKVFWIVGLVLVLLFVVMMFAGGGHGPGRHTPPDGDAAGPTPSGAAEFGGAGGHTFS